MAWNVHRVTPKLDLAGPGDHPDCHYHGFVFFLKAGAQGGRAILRDQMAGNTSQCPVCGAYAYGITPCEIEECMRRMCIECADNVVLPGEGQIFACTACAT